MYCLALIEHCFPINLHTSWMTPLFTHFSVISSTLQSPLHYLHLTIFTLPSTASSSLISSPWTSLLHPSSRALPFSLSLPPASLPVLRSPPRHSCLAISNLQSTLRHLHISLHLAKHPRLQKSYSETGGSPWHLSLVAITVNHSLYLFEIAMTS